MQRLLLAVIAIASVAGCRSNPYCLNCKDSGNGVVSPVHDMARPADLTPNPATLIDMTGMNNGMCVPSNGGVEVCDGLDNNCDGIVDNVDPGKLQSDGNNCGMCGHICSYAHAAGICTMAVCSMGACQPGYIDLNKNPADGCEYTCTPTADPTEICDGKDNNCDGQVDEGFTANWSDAQHQHPLYDNNASDCGQCGVVCSLGPGTVMSCSGTGPGGVGQCSVQGCFNGLDKNGVHQTYRHNPAAGMLSATGCEYHCPSPANQLTIDCDPNGACTFPAEVCNGIDDDCDFVVDDHLTDPGLGGACPDGEPGKHCTSTGPKITCGKGACVPGMVVCLNGGLQCMGSVGPTPEVCDGLDNNCDGRVDEPFTATWSDAGNQTPRYDSDPNNCGGCKTVCSLPNATNGCHLIGGNALGTCMVVSCNPNWYFVKHKDSNPASPTCDVTVSGSENSTASATGLGCNYNCGTTATSPEVCDGKDNDCDGCIDNGLTAPPNICTTKGVCAAGPITTKCGGAAGWKCDYSKVPNVSLDGMGNLTVSELQCDNLDNNCNGPCDENFPDVLVSGAGCTNLHPARTCTAGLGVCQNKGPFACAKSMANPPYNDIEACSVTANNAAATDEKCNGKDDDCNGLVDESTDFTLGGKTYRGWHDPYASLTVGVDPYTGQAAHTFYLYQYEASRPDATGTSQGTMNARACANPAVLPWADVSMPQAQAACAAITDSNGSPGRLCSAWEWQQVCNGNATPGKHWSMSSSNTTYQAGVCNDSNETEQRCASSAQCAKTCNGSGECTCTTNADCSPGFNCNGTICVGLGAWPTGSIGTFGSGNQCVASGSTGTASDLSGNLLEWTSTPVTLLSGSAASIAAGPSAGQWTVTGLSGMQTSSVGAQLILSGAANGGNNGTFNIVSYVSSTSVVIANPNGAVDAGGAIAWLYVYSKIRGGSFDSPMGGDVCEFDFDIQKAAFFSNDIGFRCCFDNKP